MSFSSTDIDRVEEQLDNSLWVDPARVNTRALALHVLDVMTADGHSPEYVSPLTFRTEHGLPALLVSIEENTHTPAADDDDEDDLDGVDAVETGDVLVDDQGLTVVQPDGTYWRLTDEEALGLVSALGSMLQHRAQRSRLLRRPTDQTDQLSAIADHHA